MSTPRSPLLAALVRTNQLTAAERAHLLELIRPLTIQQFTDAVEACGFTGAAYLAANADLAETGMTSAAALFHFLTIGYRELRPAPGGELLQGLSALMRCPVENREYLSQVRGALFLAQMYRRETQEQLSSHPDPGMLDRIRGLGGKPFFVIGDSQSRLYMRTETAADGSWPAPLHLLCLGGSAMGLGNERSTSRNRQRVLQWAEHGCGRLVGEGVPVFIKFGGADCSFVWTQRRVKARQLTLAQSSFPDFARRSVDSYTAFLRLFCTHVDPAHVRVCSLSPPCLEDSVWAEVYVKAHIGTTGGDYEAVLRGFRELELPTLEARTGFYALYNEMLKQMCRELGLTYVDDYTPSLDARGMADPKFYPGHKGADFHLEYAPTCDLFMDRIGEHV